MVQDLNDGIVPDVVVRAADPRANQEHPDPAFPTIASAAYQDSYLPHQQSTLGFQTRQHAPATHSSLGPVCLDLESSATQEYDEGFPLVKTPIENTGPLRRSNGLTDTAPTRQPIHQAAQNGHLRVADALLRARPDCCDLRDEMGTTPLFLASMLGHRATAELLLSKGADPNAQAVSDRNRGPLHNAAQCGHLEVVRLLLSHNAVIDIEEDDQATPLWLACQDGHLEVARFLISRGANINAASKISGANSLYTAAQNGHTDVARLLVKEGALVDVLGGRLGSALFVASQEGHKDIVEFLLARGANPNDKRLESGDSPLHEAAYNGHVDALALLIKYGGHVDNVTASGWSPLMCASEGGHLKVVELLIKHKADIHIKEEDDTTALWLASQGGHVKIMELLLSKGAAQDNALSTDRRPIHQAAQGGHLEAVKLLKEYGAAIDEICKGDEVIKQITPLWIASQCGHEDVVLFLLENGAEAVIHT